MRAVLQQALDALTTLLCSGDGEVTPEIWQKAQGGKAMEAIEQALAEPEVSPEQPHTDHPLRHFDRTCPACVKGEG